MDSNKNENRITNEKICRMEVEKLDLFRPKRGLKFI